MSDVSKLQDDDTDIEASEMQFWNARCSMHCTDGGILIDNNDIQFLKALYTIVVSVLGKVTYDRDEQLQKA